MAGTLRHCKRANAAAPPVAGAVPRLESGKEHSRHFDRKIDAQQWLRGHLGRGPACADPKAGRITFAAFFAAWSARQVWAPGTVLAMSLAARSRPSRIWSMKRVRPLKSRPGSSRWTSRARPRHGQDAVRQRQVGVPRRDATG